MATPTVAADTTAPPPTPPVEPTPAAVPDQKVSHLPPLPHQPTPAPVPAQKKRKLEDAGFRASDYYKIRAVVADLRARFVQVYEATDFRNTDAACEILKEIKVVMELSKKMRLKLGGTSEPVKPSEKPPARSVKHELVKPSEKPSAEPVKDELVKQSEKPSTEPAKDESVKPSENSSAVPVNNEPAGATPPVENNEGPQEGQAA